eukprot:4892872-Alexandrium_andersonii.AAC.1
MDGARGGVSRFGVPRSGAAPGAASEERPVLRRRVTGPERGVALGLFPELTTAIGEKVVWWPGGRESAT